MSKPKRVFKRDSLRLSIWANSKVVNGTLVQTYSATFDKVYRDGNQWRYSKNFSIEDLPKIASAADEAFKAYEKRNQIAIRRRKQRTGRNPLTLSSRPLTKVVDDNFIDKFIGKISNVFNE